MRRNIPPPKSIADYGGLQPYLNATADLHNGLKYRSFIHRINPNRKHPIPKAAIAEDFNVHRDTVYRWLAIYELEQASAHRVVPDHQETEVNPFPPL